MLDLPSCHFFWPTGKLCSQNKIYNVVMAAELDLFNPGLTLATNALSELDLDGQSRGHQTPTVHVMGNL